MGVFREFQRFSIRFFSDFTYFCHHYVKAKFEIIFDLHYDGLYYKKMNFFCPFLAPNSYLDFNAGPQICRISTLLGSQKHQNMTQNEINLPLLGPLWVSDPGKTNRLSTALHYEPKLNFFDQNFFFWFLAQLSNFFDITVMVHQIYHSKIQNVNISLFTKFHLISSL